LLERSWIGGFARNVAVGWATVTRQPPRGARLPAWPARSRLLWGAFASIAVVAAVMVSLDGWSLSNVRRLPAEVVATFQILTDFGLSGWFLFPLGILLIALAALNTRSRPLYVRNTLASLSIRAGFLFSAIAVPGLAVAIIKRLIGRARPFVEGQDPWAYQWLVWRPDYASLPSGHSTSAFSAAVAIGAIWPQARPFMWAYAVTIALSRVAVTAHHPSDVIAGAIFGTVGALLVRHWFASRRLGFTVEPGGGVRPLPGPSWMRIRETGRRLVAGQLGKSRS
jgi:membrane-associated phospholipid phosphatase